jgi:hypothetical protein
VITNTSRARLHDIGFLRRVNDTTRKREQNPADMQGSRLIAGKTEPIQRRVRGR